MLYHIIFYQILLNLFTDVAVSAREDGRMTPLQQAFPMARLPFQDFLMHDSCDILKMKIKVDS